MNVNAAGFQQKLLNWFSQHKRPLPWRIHGNPYRILVVEVMLQQTQIKTVLPYYERWLKAFPDIQALARAPIDRVLKLWEGLGYYSRARNLHATAQIIVEKFGGRIPSEPKDLQSLPGIGRYTAGAISSIAFGKPTPLVDGNVARVLSRIFNLKKDVTKLETQEHLYELAEKMISKKNPGDFNQALMELGSLVCIPEFPKCPMCPVKNLCTAFKTGNPSKLPVKSNATRIKKIQMVVGILKREQKLLVRKRPDSGIWGGLWELPGTVRTKNQTLEEALRDEFENTLSIPVMVKQKFPPLVHRFTHRLALISPFHLVERNGKQNRNAPGVRWITSRDLKKLSFPAPHQILLRQHLVTQ